MWLPQDTQNSEADLRVPVYILDHGPGSQPDNPPSMSVQLMNLPLALIRLPKERNLRTSQA